VSKTTKDKRPPAKWRFDSEHRIWRQQYRSRRYLEYMTFKELVRRAEDVLLNSHTLNRELKIGLYPTDAEAGYWAEMFTHILEECVLRNLHYRDLLKEVDSSITPKYDWPGLQEAVSKVGVTKLQTGNFLIKYGKEQYLRPMLDTGSVRISPASFYDDPSLNSAIRDTELELSLYSLSSEVTLIRLDPVTGEEIGQIESEGYIERSFQVPTNYYVYCLANMFSPRMFGDFDADSCLIIHRPAEFMRLLNHAFEEKMSDWTYQAKLVNYIDPFNTGEFRPELYFGKHFRYAYQKEYRVVWLPPTPKTILKPVFVELGNLDEYCELIFAPRQQAA
jgi:hypothetical protein